MKKQIVFGLLLAFCSNLSAKDHLITEFGAKPSPSAVNTEAINRAVRQCHSEGGGRVIVPQGVFLSGTIVLMDNVELHLENGSTLLASSRMEDFPAQPLPAYRSQKDPGGWRALLYAANARNIAVTGPGMIDGNGASHPGNPKNKIGSDMDGRPRNLLFISCSRVRVEQIQMRNSALWNQHYLDCEDVTVDRINVYNHANRNNDGIDIDGCRRFVLSNSVFDTDDDAIVIKSTGAAATEDLVITNCIASSHCNAIKAGTESTGGFRNIAISNCVVKPSRHKEKPVYGTSRGITGLSLEIVDGGVMEGVVVSNISIEGTDCPIFVRLGNRARKHTADAPAPPRGTMRNISIHNVTAYNTGNYSASVTGVPGQYVEDISLSQIRLINAGGLQPGGYIPNIAGVKEDEQGYPQPTVWKELPSSGLFIRHAKRVQVSGLMLSSTAADPRPPVVAADVEGLQISQVSVANNTASTFLSAIDVRWLSVEKPLGWTKQLTDDKQQ
ncbi:glycoside hydrolase family 28 protein [Chitinophaga lutea]